MHVLNFIDKILFFFARKVLYLFAESLFIFLNWDFSWINCL